MRRELGFLPHGMVADRPPNRLPPLAQVLADPLGIALAMQSFRNVLYRNGGLEVWQRGAGGSASIAVAASSTVYNADGFSLTTGANQACTVSQQAGLAHPSLPRARSRYCARVQRNSGQTGVGPLFFEMPLDTDEVIRLRGTRPTLSGLLRGGANWSPTGGVLTATLYLGTGSPAKRSLAGYTSEVTPIALTIALPADGTTVVPFFGTASAPVSIAAAQGSIAFQWSPTGTAGVNDYFEVDDLQIDAGPMTPFDRLPFEAELRACQRHYWKSFAYATAPAQSTGLNAGVIAGGLGPTGAGGWYIGVRFPVQMRSAPTMTSYNPAAANAQIRDVSAGGDCSGTGFNYTTADMTLIACNGNAASTVNSVLQVHAQADAGI